MGARATQVHGLFNSCINARVVQKECLFPNWNQMDRAELAGLWCACVRSLAECGPSALPLILGLGYTICSLNSDMMEMNDREHSPRQSGRSSFCKDAE